MALRKWAYLFMSPGFDPKEHSISMSSSECEVRIIGIEMTQKESVIAIAKALVEDGVQMIELCGGFGPMWIARITDAIQGAIPVGSVAYGPEARGPLLNILKS